MRETIITLARDSRLNFTQPMILLKGLDWHKSDVALKQLKEMLWGLEALRVFDDKLKRALQEIDNAKKAMEKELTMVCFHQISHIYQFKC